MTGYAPHTRSLRVVTRGALQESVAMEPARITPDDKDWSVVITEGCPECGFDPRVDVTTAGSLIRESVPFWREVLGREEVRRRPHPTMWSPLEYGCHVRDVCRVFEGRLRLMLAEDDARFADWDQDAAAVAERYDEQDPSQVAEEYASAAAALASGFDAVSAEQWQRRGTRSNGTHFTVATFAVYLLHDLLHHQGDVVERESVERDGA